MPRKAVDTFYPNTVADVLCLALCRMGCAGLAPQAPGTWGSLVALLMAPIYFFPLSLMGRSIVLVVLFFVGSLASSRAELLLKRKDPSQIVVDEWLGMWLIFLPFTKVSLSMFVTGFVLFRFFDIVKPWPVRASEQWMRHGFGVMLDDAVAACMGMVCLAVLFC